MAELPLGRDSILWRIVTEPAMLIPSGPRALLLQVAHPLVAAGVEQHSDYERNPWQRLVRTLDVMTVLTFANPRRSARMTELLRRRHAEVTGTSADGARYRALDPALLLWVWATLIDTLVAVHERHVRPLGRGDRERLYEEWKHVGVATGVPRARMPATWDDFAAYVERVEAEELQVTRTTRTVATQIVQPPLPWPLGRLAGAMMAALAAPLLPAALRDELSLSSPLPRRLSDSLAIATRAAARVVPGPVRRLPLQVTMGLWVRPPRRRHVLRAAPIANVA